MSGAAAVHGASRLALDPEIATRLHGRLPAVAEQTVLAVVAEVPGYAGAFSGELRANIERGVQMALRGFVRLAENARDSDPRIPLQPALEGAYELGRGEARDGRTMDALLGAYRVGARVAWRELSAVFVGEGVPAAAVAQFAELVFAYIDELSAASAAGHADEHATTGRVRELYLERLGERLLEGASPEVLDEAAERAGWDPPETLTAVLLRESQAGPALSTLDARTLRLHDDRAGDDETAILLVPDAAGAQRAALLRALKGRGAVVGPARPWSAVASSVRRAGRARDLVPAPGGEAVDTEAHLAALVLGSDPEALADLRRRVLEPLAELRPSAAERLEQTLRSWLLHQGRRDDVAADLAVHPQTVRYRMTQLRDLYGDRLRDPGTVLELVIATACPSARTAAPAPSRAPAR
jgi:hypothetical protein